MLDYPAQSFFQFFENHRLMHKERPKWRTVTGGSQTYVRAVAAELGQRVRTNSPVTRVAPFGDKVTVLTADKRTEVFDDVILACHSDQALRLVQDSYEDRAFLLRSVHYRPNTIYLHRDPALMPTRRSAWASWNVIKQDNGDICLTYWMNRLQGLAHPGSKWPVARWGMDGPRLPRGWPQVRPFRRPFPWGPGPVGSERRGHSCRLAQN